MGRIYFHSPSGEHMLGRRYAARLVNDMACAAISLDSWEYDPILHLLPPDCYLRNKKRAHHFKEDFRTWMMVGEKDFHLPGGVRANSFIVALNTALVMGSRPVKLLARLHGQCEIHTWVDGPNRAWLAGIVEEGCKSGILCDWGWEGMAEFLRQRDDEAVVTSYSVCELFPSPPESWEYRENEAEEGCFGPDGRAWYDMSCEEQWKVAMDELRDRVSLELEPENFDDFWFGDKERITMFDIDRMRRECEQETISHGNDT